ncbi:MAG: PAS domain S-box protein [Halobacteriota archaeon]|nr:PAS domain S-box protein [Halobacteriota archaeon]
MNDEDKTKIQLINELIELRNRNAELEKVQSEHKQMQEELIKHRDHLDWMVEERTSDLRKFNEQILCEINERDRLEKMLLESEEMYRTLVETSPDAVIATDLDGKIIDVSRRAIELHGFESVVELIGRSSFELVASEERSRAKNDLKRVLEEGFVRNVEYTLLKRDSTRFIGELSLSMVEDANGEPNAIIGISRDITCRKKVEDALRESEEKYRNMVERANDGIVIIQDDVIKFANNKVADMLGYTLEEFIETEFLKYVPLKFQDDVKTRYDARLVGEELSEHFEVEVIKRDGEILTIDINAGIIDYEGKLADFVFIRDITEKKKIEMERKRSSEELQKAYEELKELDRMKTEFAAIATHEIGTPLSILKSNVEMLESGLFGDITDHQKERLETISRNIDYLVKLSGEMMDISRIDADRLKLNKSHIFINDLIRDTVHEMQHLADDKKISIKAETSEVMSLVSCDGDRIKQVLSNLVKNAIKFTPEFGEIKLGFEKNHDELMVSVSDNGIGIPGEEHEKIFERFYEIGDYLSHETGGAGLGLAIVTGIVEAHGGKVWVESAVGKGSTFYFTLPN